MNNMQSVMKCLLKSFVLLALLLTLHPQAWAQPKITWDSKSLLVDGRRVVSVMGEIHYSRLPEDEWESAVKNMKAGGVTMIATYVFWNHVEEQEGQWDWSGRRSLRHFWKSASKSRCRSSFVWVLSATARCAMAASPTGSSPKASRVAVRILAS